MAVRPVGQVVVLLWPRNWHSPTPRASATVNRAISSPPRQSTPRSLGNPSNDCTGSVVCPSTSVEDRGRRTRFLFPCARNYGSHQVTSMKGNWCGRANRTHNFDESNFHDSVHVQKWSACLSTIGNCNDRSEPGYRILHHRK